MTHSFQNEPDSFDETLINPPIIDMLHFEGSIQGYSITFVPRDEVSSDEKEMIVVKAATPDGHQIANWLKRLSEAARGTKPAGSKSEPGVGAIVHGGGDLFTLRFSDGSDYELGPASRLSREAKLRAYNALQFLGLIAETAFRIELLSAGKASS